MKLLTLDFSCNPTFWSWDFGFGAPAGFSSAKATYSLLRKLTDLE